VIIPDDLVERQRFYADLVRQCTASRSDRFSFYNILRNYYLFGSMDAKGAPYNKIGSTIDTLNSFIYSPDTLRFSLHLGTEATQEDVAKSVPLAQEVTEQWRLSKTHIRFGLGLRWSCVYGIMLMKVHWSGQRVRTFLVEPHQFGVYREDVAELEDQEAFTHHYTITRTQLQSMLEAHPRRKEILLQSGSGGKEARMDFGGGLQRLLLGASVGGVPGSVAIPGSQSSIQGGIGGGGPMYDYAPKVEAELIDMCDLYVWSDKDEDYKLVTQAAPGITIFDRPSANLGHVKGLAPFVVIRPEFNLYDYFWGESFAARLTWLQDWRTERTLDIRKLLGRQVDPSWSIIGGGGITEEKLLALKTRGGMVNFPQPNVKATPNQPTVPADVFSEIAQIDAMFDDTAGLGHVLQGKGEPGVRSRGQADLMARLGSARPKERAIAAEESAEEVAGVILRSVQDHSDQRFGATVEGKKLTFAAEQFTRDYEVKVDAHSSSPIFVEDRKHDAITLMEAKAITRETLLDMFDPPNLQALKEDLKLIEQREAEARKMELQMQQQQGGPPKKRG
jgi:hypothetical protein